MQSLENTSIASAKDAAPICDTCPRKEDCTFMCENKIDQFVKEEAEADRSISPKLIALERKEFPTRTIFPKKFPVPVVCSEFCGRVVKNSCFQAIFL